MLTTIPVDVAIAILSHMRSNCYTRFIGFEHVIFIKKFLIIIASIMLINIDIAITWLHILKNILIVLPHWSHYMIINKCAIFLQDMLTHFLLIVRRWTHRHIGKTFLFRRWQYFG